MKLSRAWKFRIFGLSLALTGGLIAGAILQSCSNNERGMNSGPVGQPAEGRSRMSDADAAPQQYSSSVNPPPTNASAGTQFSTMPNSPRAAAVDPGAARAPERPRREALADAPVRFSDELLVIERRREPVPARSDDEPGSGCMLYTEPGSTQTQPIPLKHTDVAASISAYISSVRVTQTFANPFSSKIEAVYVFPLPENSAVSDFVMKVGDRSIRGIIREREEAQQIYNAARAQGYTASLLSQERPNIFTQRVANIEPGKSIDVDITYYSTLAYSDGAYEFVFPMVVGPRFNPPGTTSGIGAASRNAPGSSGQSTEVTYLRPSERPSADISLAVDVDAGVRIEDVVSPSHQIKVDRPSANIARVTLAGGSTIPNKDFVLRYQVAGDVVKTALMTTRDARGGFFTLMLVPPKNLSSQARQPVEMVFVLDCSGSMSGRPIEQAKDAVEQALGDLQPTDTFQIIDFAQNASTLGRAPLLATAANIRKGQKYLRSLNANGGTYMLTGMNAALNFPHDESRLRVVAFMTDGYIGNEDEVLRTLDAGLGDTRVFGFGVGEAPNRHLMDEMSRLGRGAVGYVGLKDDPEPVMSTFMKRATRPALTNVAIDWGDANVTDVYPSRIPDLFVGRPVVITGRYEGNLDPAIRVTGRVDGGRKEFTLRTTETTPNQARVAIPQIWARNRIAELTRRNLISPGGVDARIESEIRRTALSFNLVSRFTSFIAVDTSHRTAGDFGTTVQVPAPVPEGVRYETTVGDHSTPRRD